MKLLCSLTRLLDLAYTELLESAHLLPKLLPHLTHLLRKACAALEGAGMDDLFQ